MYDKLTRKDIEEMGKEIEHRKVVVRKKLIEDVKTARAHGDLSENFEYKAARQEKNQNESRIRYLERMIRTAEIVEEGQKTDQAGLGKTVEVYFEDEDESEEFSIVTTVRGNSLKNLISTESPLGKALSGHCEGDRIYVQVTPETGYYVVIRSIRETTEEAALRKF